MGRNAAVRVGLAVVMVALSGIVPHAQDDEINRQLEQRAGITADAATAFFESLRRALGTGDRRAACAMAAYPLAHDAGIVASASDCEARYDEIFTLGVRRAVGRQQYTELFVTGEGVAFGVGELWFAARCAARPCGEGTVRITRVNAAPGLRPPAGKVLIA